MTNFQRITFTCSDGLELHAKVYSPSTPSKPCHSLPAVLILEGSGKSPLTVEPESSPFVQLAEVLAEQGYLVFKYNKRGSGENSDRGSFWKATFQSDQEDAHSALKALLQDERVDPERIFLLGHSFGGPQALILATKAEVHGVILLTSTIRPTDQLLLEQNRILRDLADVPSQQTDFCLKVMKEDLEQIREGKFSSDSPRCSLQDGVQIYESSIQVPWLREALKTNFAETATKVHCPLLFIFGTSDAIIPESDFIFAQKTFAGLSRDVEFCMLRHLDHFMTEHDSPKASVDSIRQVQTTLKFNPLSKAMADTVLDWLKKQNRTAKESK